jgi:hypothetical protein
MLIFRVVTTFILKLKCNMYNCSACSLHHYIFLGMDHTAYPVENVNPELCPVDSVAREVCISESSLHSEAM